MIIGLLIAALMIVSFWMIFAKAGQPGWAILIPIYNIIVLLEVAKKPWWWIFLFLIPVVNIVIAILVYHAISLNFGKSAGFTVGLVLLGIVFFPILAFGDAKYNPVEGATAEPTAEPTPEPAAETPAEPEKPEEPKEE